MVNIFSHVLCMWLCILNPTNQLLSTPRLHLWTWSKLWSIPHVETLYTSNMCIVVQQIPKCICGGMKFCFLCWGKQKLSFLDSDSGFVCKIQKKFIHIFDICMGKMVQKSGIKNHFLQAYSDQILHKSSVSESEKDGRFQKSWFLRQ